MGSRTKRLTSRCLPICWLGGSHCVWRIRTVLSSRRTTARPCHGRRGCSRQRYNHDSLGYQKLGPFLGSSWSRCILRNCNTVDVCNSRCTSNGDFIFHREYTATPLSPSDISTLMEKWQSVALSAPNELSVIRTIKQAGGANGTLFLEYRGTYYGTQSSFDSLTSDWATLLSPGNLTSQVHNWYDGLVALSGPLSTSVPEQRVTIFAKSLFTKSPVTAAQWTSLLSYLGDQGLKSKLGWYIKIDRYGGGVAKLPADATSFAHRDAVLCFQFVTGLLLPPFPSDGIPFLNGMLGSLDPNPQAAYVNYVDPTLTPAQWKLQYYGSHYPPLSTIKRAVDPHNVFRFPQSIGLFS